MSVKIHRIGLGEVVVFVIGAGAILMSPETPALRSSSSIKNASPLSPVPVSANAGNFGLLGASYNMAQVAVHDSGSSCWTVIDGEVYDLTPFINSHPGGTEAILWLCGINGSAAFNDQHGGQGRPANELSGLQIGVFNN